jgi:hypothetical protein
MLWGSGPNIELFNYILRHENASLPEKGTFFHPYNVDDCHDSI